MTLRRSGRLRCRPALALAAVFVASAPAAVAGQDVIVREGSADVALDRRLARLLAADPLVVSSNTTIPAGDTIRRSVLVLDASLIHEGVILGDLVLVEAGAFVRPRSVVAGDVVNIAGGLYRSELARIGGTIIDLPAAPYSVVREPDRIVILATATPSRLVLDGFMGLRTPTYDRVNGLDLAWGAGYRLPMIRNAVPSLRGRVGWLTQRGDPTYAATLSVRAGATTLAAGHEREWDTTERWIKEDLRNSLNYLWNGRDFRDYHEVERSWAGISRDFGDQARRFHATVGVRAQLEDATSLRAGKPWFLWGSRTRENPSIDDGRVVSVVAGADLSLRGATTDFEARVEYETAHPWQGGDHTFDRLLARGVWAMQGFAHHTLSIDFMGQAPVRGPVLPRQRWSFVGGTETLHTQPFAAFYGDHVAFVETRYIIPLPDAVALPLLGAPDLQLLHATGMAWTEDTPRDLEQEVGVRLQFRVLYARFALDPATRNTAFDVAFSWPFGRSYPWQ